MWKSDSCVSPLDKNAIFVQSSEQTLEKADLSERKSLSHSLPLEVHLSIAVSNVDLLPSLGN